MHGRLGALALTTLLLLSGCSFIGASPPEHGGGTATPTSANTATQMPTPTVTATPTPVALPDGYGPSGVDDLSAALGAHQSALVDSESFTISYRATLLTSQGRSTIASVRSTNVTQARGYEATNLTNGATRENFLTDGTAYVRTNPAGGEVYYTFSSTVT
jgi:hypothetical protein